MSMRAPPRAWWHRRETESVADFGSKRLLNMEGGKSLTGP